MNSIYRRKFSRRNFLAASAATTVTASTAFVARDGIAKNVTKPTVVVVHDKSKKVIKNFTVDSGIVQKLVDKAVMTVAGVDNIAKAWGKFVKPGQKVAVKFNGLFRKATTHGEVITAVTNGIQKAGVKADNIVIYDRSDKDMRTAMIKVNRDGSEPRVYGTNNNYGPSVMAGPVKTKLSSILLEADVLINIPILKTHCLAGMSGAMKNHLGTVHNASAFHKDENKKNSCLYVADLNSLKEIKDKTKLCICDGLYAMYSEGPGYSHKHRWDYYSIIAGTDFVAFDTVLSEIIKAKRLEKGLGPYFRPLRHLERAVKLGLGEGDIKNINRIEVEI